MNNPVAEFDLRMDVSIGVLTGTLLVSLGQMTDIVPAASPVCEVHD
jgi:hypothetical protein